MSNRDRLMDYLYGEMNEAERRRFEEELALDSALTEELESLRQVRSMLDNLPDSRPEPSVITLAPAPAPWKKWGLRAAAALALLFVLFRFNARIELGSGGMVFSLGERRQPVTAMPADTALAALTRRLERREQMFESRLDSLWEKRLALSEQNLSHQWEARLLDHRLRRELQVQQLLQVIRQEERPELVGLIQNMQIEQQKELRLLLEDFWEHYQLNRETDLQSIEKEFVELYRNVEQQQTETAALIRGLR